MLLCILTKGQIMVFLTKEISKFVTKRHIKHITALPQ